MTALRLARLACVVGFGFSLGTAVQVAAKHEPGKTMICLLAIALFFVFHRLAGRWLTVALQKGPNDGR